MRISVLKVYYLASLLVKVKHRSRNGCLVAFLNRDDVDPDPLYFSATGNLQWEMKAS